MYTSECFPFFFFFFINIFHINFFFFLQNFDGMIIDAHLSLFVFIIISLWIVSNCCNESTTYQLVYRVICTCVYYLYCNYKMGIFLLLKLILILTSLLIMLDFIYYGNYFDIYNIKGLGIKAIIWIILKYETNVRDHNNN